MNIRLISHPFSILMAALIASLSSYSLFGDQVQYLIDDFGHEHMNSYGHLRLILDDTSAGGKSTSAQTVKDGVLHCKGDLVPPRGQPGWVSLVFLLSKDGSAVDLSMFQGIKMKLRVHEGMLSVSANSNEIKNYDYHAAIVQSSRDHFSEVKIPFSNMRRAWSEQIALNTQSIGSISLVAVAMQPGKFEYEIDEIVLY